ncbi:DUF1045 domain-containing protein [Rhizobium sp. RAF56]|uniref:DUF1045 domain-containing protein n=1 Tax=Rhizobium sp. RAF56 TaxID=3233062 RepID=UPI003F9AF85E
MRYAICFTPPASDPLTLAAAEWLGRSVFSGETAERPPIRGLGIQEIAFYTAMPRRYGFSGMLKAPFRLREDCSEAQLLRDLMHFSGTFSPFTMPPLGVARIDDLFGLAPTNPCGDLDALAATVVQHFDRYRAPLSEAELERCDPDALSGLQFTNLFRWGCPNVMGQYRFHMPLTGPVAQRDATRIEHALKSWFAALLTQPVTFGNIALMVEVGAGGPFRVHSLHPLGKVGARRIA